MLPRRNYIYFPFLPLIKIMDSLHGQNFILHYQKEVIGGDYCTGNVEDCETVVG